MNNKKAVMVLMCFSVVCLALPGRAVAQEKANYNEWVTAYQNGDTSKAYYVGLAFFNGLAGAEKNYQTAREWFLKAADKGDANAFARLGDIYLNGYGVAANGTEAVKWYLKAADKDNYDGQENLGDIYYYGDAGKRDYAEAIKWYRKAAGNELASAPCSKLGEIYLLGEGVKADPAEALKWFLKADGLGDITAAGYIAEIYRAGIDGKKDLAKYAEWLVKGSVNGDPIAMRRLGEAYAAGEGVARNNTEAYKWLAVASAKEEDAPTDLLLEQISKKMSSGELAGAKKQASELMAKYVTPGDRERKAYDKTLEGR